MVGFDNIREFVVGINTSKKFQSRFLDEEYNVLPEEHLDQIAILDLKASKFLWDYISATSLHKDIPFKKDLFKIMDKLQIKKDNQKEVKKWLYRRGLPFSKDVYILWQPDHAAIAPWKIFIKYFENFYLGGEDVTIIDESLNWALLFYHEDEIYFGSNENYVPSEYDDEKFLW